MLVAPASPQRTTEPLCPACFELDGVDPHGNRTLQAMRWLHLPYAPRCAAERPVP